MLLFCARRAAFILFILTCVASGAAEQAPANDGAHVSTDSVFVVAKLGKAAVLRQAGPRAAALKRYGGTAEGEAAVIRALQWLQKVQEPDGSWTYSSGGDARVAEDYRPGMTGLALLCFLGHGETPISQEYGLTVQKAIIWLIKNQQADGTFANAEGKNYSLAIATLALSEAYMMTKVPLVGKAAEKSVRLLLKKQHESGGWYWYSRGERGFVFEDKNPGKDDTSLGGWCIQALKAAKVAGLKVPNLDAALKNSGTGLKDCATPNGTFVYLSGGKSQPSGGGANGLTAAGVLGLQLAGQGKSGEAQRGLKYLSANATCDWSKPWGKPWALYYWYDLTQANFISGGLDWAKWNKSFSVQLTGAQTADGYWESIDQLHSRVYATTLCTLMLETYYRVSPAKGRP